MWIVTVKVLEESWLWHHCCVPFRLKAIKPRFQQGTVTLIVNPGLGLRSSQHQPCGEAGSHALIYMIYRFGGREAGWKSQLIGWSQTILEDQEEAQDLLVFSADHSLSSSRLLSAPCRPTRELLRGRVGPGARSLQLWPAGLWRRFPRLQAGHPGAGTAGHGAGADRGRRADGKLVRGAAEEGGVQSSAPHCVGQGRGFRYFPGD